MSYPANSVGAHMDFELIKIREEVNLEVVHRYLRRFEKELKWSGLLIEPNPMHFKYLKYKYGTRRCRHAVT